jgi:hypothetical protein
LSHAQYYGGGALGTTVKLLNTGLASNKVAVPLVFNKDFSSDWVGGFNVYSVGTAGTINTKWVRANSDPTQPGNSFTTAPATGTADGITNYYAPTIGGMLGDFTGAVYVESTDPILVYFDSTNYAQSILVTSIGHNYD